jgi:phospholipid/cholesterol/gamma-HCH transport system substrate-binding protein
MKQQTKLELVVGLFVLVGLCAVGYLALRIGAGALVGGNTYVLEARFTNSGGLNPGSNVIVSGVPVGRVDAITLNSSDFSSVVKFSIRSDVKLPVDTIASIKTTGLIGDKFLALAPGGESTFLPAGALITDTESTVDLESLISRFAFGNVSDKPKPSTAQP